MNYKALIFVLAFAVGASVTQASETQNKKNFFSNTVDSLVGYKNTAVDFIVAKKTVIGAVTILCGIAPLFKYITNGKDFKNCDELDSLNDKIAVLQANPTSVAAYKDILHAMIQRLLCVIRSVTGHSGYDITVKKETTTNPDGSETTLDLKQKISPTKLCKYIMDLAPTSKALVNYTALLVFVKELAGIIEKGDYLGIALLKPVDLTK